ncbi:hypothetical protein CCACVL1_23568 [Corchorus capsularis]|uniref:Uncharacterized protein n=1 Tax=Corchorus capsularis TaxID=210143 RepID=A0A1R3GTC6_COCAP|nr:hypothetical protein CCACVL1_23568 [Corchorus capsularis]
MARSSRLQGCAKVEQQHIASTNSFRE